MAVTTSQYFALWQAICDLTGDAAIGIKLATALPSGQLPPSLLAAYHARDYRDALQRVARYKQLCAPERLRLSEEGDVCIVALEWMNVGQTEPAALVDASMATLLELGRRGTGEAIAARLVDLARPKTNVSAHEAHFGCRVRFDAQNNCLYLHRSDLGRAFTAYNTELLDILTPALDQSLAERQRPHSFGDTVKWLLVHQLSGGRPDIPTAARELGVSERTLQRRLGGEGTSFQLLLTAVRRERALELLADSALDINEVAFLLGYEDQSSFSRLPGVGGRDPVQLACHAPEPEDLEARVLMVGRPAPKQHHRDNAGVAQVLVSAAGALVGDEILAANQEQRSSAEIGLGTSVPGSGKGHAVDLVQNVDAPGLATEHPDASGHNQLLHRWNVTAKSECQQSFTEAGGVCQGGVDEDVEPRRQSWFAVGRHRVAPHQHEANALRD